MIRFFMIVALACAVHAQAQPELTYLSVEEARLLVHVALPNETRRLPGLTLWLSEKDQANPPRCLIY
jgi:hypothetical protein